MPNPNRNIKVLSVFGTRPEATKMVPLVLALRDEPGIDSYVCVTAQHRELLDQMLTPFDIKPDYDLNIMTEGQTLAYVTNRVLTGLPPILSAVNPDLLLVHGDTITTFAASLAAFFAKIPVGHVEAGLRTYDKYRPYPEEVNRKLVTAVADLFFAPTQQSCDNLLKENVPDKAIYVTGNTAVDFLKYVVADNYRYQCEPLNHLDTSKRIILMTSHRYENYGQPLENICRAVRKLVDDFPDTMLVWPVHPSKAVTEPAHRLLSGHERILLTPAVGPFDMINMMKRSYMLLTDSGGLQEEAPAFDLPVLVLREVTERPEGLTAGTLALAGIKEIDIYNHAAKLLTDASAYQKMAQAPNPFGDGHASQRIIKAIKEQIKC
ncbi:MAG: UDP-N-acetylglucosamine 2-epimerase (non-hydrolyzing) [Defluviitaleaceae bacterium]|nr:UDP-N-acetylglucosamine 2-epimerase (non-hydrolyzing) [Defluviitaleaceae bacterium]